MATGAPQAQVVLSPAVGSLLLSRGSAGLLSVSDEHRVRAELFPATCGKHDPGAIASMVQRPSAGWCAGASLVAVGIAGAWPSARSLFDECDRACVPPAPADNVIVVD